MNTALSHQIDQVLLSAHLQPAVSIILPFDPKMDAKQDINQRIQNAVARVEAALTKIDDRAFARLVMRKLKSVISQLNFSTFRKALAIYVSPVFEKVLYVDLDVQEKVIVDDSFEIRDLVYAKKDECKFLLLVPGERHNSVWLFNGLSLTLIQSNPVTDHRSGNESADHALAHLLQAYPLPVVAVGSEQRLQYFKQHTSHLHNIVSFIPAPSEPFTSGQLSGVIAAVSRDWQNLHRRYTRARIARAASAGQLSVGLEQCQAKASRNARQLLVVEKNFMGPAGKPLPEEDYDHFSCIKDPVDDLIEKVLSCGGDVEFVDDGSLASYGQVVLISCDH